MPPRVRVCVFVCVCVGGGGGSIGFSPRIQYRSESYTDMIFSIIL